MATKARIHRGEARTIRMRVVYEVERTPFDLTGYDLITVYLKKSNRRNMVKTTDDGSVTVLDSKLSIIQLDLTVADTNQLRTGKRQDFEVRVEKPGVNRLVRFFKSLDVQDF